MITLTVSNPFLAVFCLGLLLGCVAYSYGWRAQSPFYKEPK